MNRRLEILSAAIGLRGLGGSLDDFLWNLFAPPCHVLGARRIQRIESGKNMRAVWIKGYDRPLYLPNEFSSRCIYQPIAEETYPRNWHYYCTPETPIERGDTFLDCGAAEGLFAFLARDKGARGVVFEPNPIYFRALQQTFDSDENVLVVNAALGDAPGKGFLSNEEITSKVNSDSGHPIRIETIDGICDQLKIKPSYLKADIEGFESKLLYGAAETIATHHPKIAITTYHAENNSLELASMLKRFWPNYRIRIKGISDRYGKPVMIHAW